VRLQDVALAGELGRRPADEVPVLGVAGGDTQGPLLPAAADADRRVRALRPLRLIAGGRELIELAVEIGRRLAEQPDDHLTGLFEPVETLGQGSQLDAVGR